MKIILSEKLPRILKAKKQLEEKLNVKISNRGKETFIEGKPEDEYIAEKVIEALNFGFPFSDAILVKENEDFTFEKIRIKDYAKSHNLARVRGRIIGANGKTLKTLCELTKCYFQVKDNEVGIIGDAENMKIIINAIISLAKGTKTANVYAYLEKHQPQPIFDLGLKKK